MPIDKKKLEEQRLAYEQELKKMKKANENKVVGNVDKTIETRDKTLSYIDSLSSSEKDSLLKQIHYKKCRDSYLEYVKHCYPTYIMTRFHRYLCAICQNIVERVENANKPNATQEEINKGKVRVLISVPPRHGKSETITKTLPSWFVGRNPNLNAILTAYNSDLAEKFEDANRQKTREYGKDIFGIEISDSQDNKTLYEIKGRKGGVMGVGVMGGITGNGGELIIIDDPYKSSEEANNPLMRQKLYDIFRDSIYTRLQKRGNALIVIQTRWHEEDLCGVLAKQEGWVVINIPAYVEDERDKRYDPLKREIGETLCPELGFDSKWAEDTRKEVGLKVWNALYMGKPSIDGGEIFKREWIKYYTNETRPQVFEELTMSCDLSFGGTKQSNDPCAIQVWGRVGANHYLLMRIKKRLTFTEMCEKIRSVINIYPSIKRKIVEKKANGQSVIDTLNGELGGFIAYDPKMDSKIARANAITYLFESGNIYLPSPKIDKTIEEMVDEMLKFPNGTHDDEVDAMTQYIITSEQRQSGGRVLTDSYYSTLSKAFRGMKI